jgi:hypothetical protein
MINQGIKRCLGEQLLQLAVSPTNGGDDVLGHPRPGLLLVAVYIQRFDG